MQQTSPHTRRVHQVRLCAPSQDLIWRGRNLLEDALHTVSLPAADTSPLLFIRQFNVGTIHSNLSPASLSLSLEQKLQQLSAIALPGTHPAAAQAPAVTFPDDLSAYTHFAHCLATGQSLQAWFWPRLLPGWQPTWAKRETVLLLLAHLATHALAPLATATVLHQLHRQQSLTPFLKVLHPQDGSNLLAQNGWRADSSATTASAQTPVRPRLPLLSSTLTDQWSAEDPRTLWLTAMGLIAARPMWVNEPELMAIAHHQIQAHYASLSEASPSPQARQNTLPRQQSARSPLDPTGEPPIPQAFSSPISLSSLSPSPLDPSQSATKHSPPAAKCVSPSGSDRREASPTSGPRSPAPPRPRNNKTLSLDSKSLDSKSLEGKVRVPFPGTHTDYAGLIYLLNLLEYLHLPAYLPKYNHPTFPHTLLRYVAQRLGVPAEDPILTVCGNDAVRTMNDEVTPDPFTIHHSSPITSLLPTWYAALRIYTRRHTTRRHTRLTLKSLIDRPGRLALTPTHLDLTFDLSQVDIRIRRAGLDLNPGWLPWFGRVVQFHYEALNESSRERRSGGAL